MEGGKGQVCVGHSKRAQKSPRCAVKCPHATGTLYAAQFCREKSPRGTGRFYERASDLNSTSQVATEPPRLGLREHQYCISATRYYCAHWNRITNAIRFDSGAYYIRIGVVLASVLNRYSRILASPNTLQTTLPGNLIYWRAGRDGRWLGTPNAPRNVPDVP